MEMKRLLSYFMVLSALFSSFQYLYSDDNLTREERKKQQIEELQKRFEWWPTDAKPAPVQDPERGGYWWWPTEPGQIMPWGNRGYIYVYKIIFDYKEEELPPPKPQELRPSLLIKKIIKNVKIYFDYDKAGLRDDAIKLLTGAVSTLKRNHEASILITGNCDVRGSEAYNEKLGRRRAESVKKFMLDNGVLEERIRIISRGKLDAVAPITDLVGMQKDRNAQFIIAEVEEIMLPYPGEPEISEAKKIDEGKFLIEEEKEIESNIKVGTKEYIIKKGDTLWKIARKEIGNGNRWEYLYKMKKDRIKNPNKLKPGQKIIIPVE
ncbi:MAG: OmpA family protein [Candidatus Omnitrophica bacterium]|nr:OmpA family protein [Candidatus Omnitrophota bacterium]